MWPRKRGEAVESVADMTDVDSVFVRGYAAALIGEAAGAGRAGATDEVARAVVELAKVAYVNRSAVRSRRSAAAGHGLLLKQCTELYDSHEGTPRGAASTPGSRESVDLNIWRCQSSAPVAPSP